MKMNYPKSMVAGDGLSVVLRPLVRDDTRALKSFFAMERPREEWFLRKDLTDPGIFDQWIENLDYGPDLPIVAVREDNGEIIGSLILSFAPAGFNRQLAHLTVTVHPAYHWLNVGTWLIHDGIEVAICCGIEQVVADCVADLEGSFAHVSRELGFRNVQTLKRYVRASQGKFRDLLVMTKNLRKHHCAFQPSRLKRILGVPKKLRKMVSCVGVEEGMVAAG